MIIVSCFCCCFFKFNFGFKKIFQIDDFFFVSVLLSIGILSSRKNEIQIFNLIKGYISKTRGYEIGSIILFFRQRKNDLA